jgi:Glyoxalase-like domain
MRHSRLAGLSTARPPTWTKTARFWCEALGRAVDPNLSNKSRQLPNARYPGPTSPSWKSSGCPTRDIHIDVETDDIPAEVARLEMLGAKLVSRL